MIVADVTFHVSVIKTETDLWLELPQGSDRWSLVARRSSLGIETSGVLRFEDQAMRTWTVLASVEDFSPLDLDRVWAYLYDDPDR